MRERTRGQPRDLSPGDIPLQRDIILSLNIDAEQAQPEASEQWHEDEGREQDQRRCQVQQRLCNFLHLPPRDRRPRSHSRALRRLRLDRHKWR